MKKIGGLLVFLVVIVTNSHTLTIDSKLGILGEDCFERIAIGYQLVNNAIYGNLTELSSRECELRCKQDTNCQAFDYGVGAKGNATCNLSKVVDKEIKENKLVPNPDYDVFIRRFHCDQISSNPIQTHIDHTNVHKPVFRPNEEEFQIPVSKTDDERIFTSYFRPSYKNNPYSNHRSRPMLQVPVENYGHDDKPQRPIYNRPDYNDHNLDYEENFGYADHRTQAKPFEDYPYRSFRPKSDHYYDVFRFQDLMRPSHTRPTSFGYRRINYPTVPYSLQDKSSNPSNSFVSVNKPIRSNYIEIKTHSIAYQDNDELKSGHKHLQGTGMQTSKENEDTLGDSKNKTYNRVIPIHQSPGQVISSGLIAISDYGGMKNIPENRRHVSRNAGKFAEPKFFSSPGTTADTARIETSGTKVCYRRVLAGKRALRSHVRRVLSCETLEQCRRECGIERRFHCESFNYKLEPGFRSKGLCELMTKPIEAFDIDRDFVVDNNYDFYEVDRNSLEPDCPETLRGPGLLHSGFLSSKPNWIEPSRKWDRIPSKDGSDRRFFDDRVGGHGRRKEEPFIPYLIGKIQPEQPSVQSRGYGGHYYSNNDDYKNTHDYWHKGQDFRPETGRDPFDYRSLGRKYDEEYGVGRWQKSRFNDTPAGLVLGASNYYNERPRETYGHERHDDEDVSDCSSRRRPGMTLGSGAIRRSLLAHNVLECEAACFDEKEFRCVSYSYRYSNIHDTDNCFLSERPYRGLDLASDSGSDVYAMPKEHGCAVSPTPYVESECFWHVRSEAAVAGAAVQAALTVTGLGACEAECIRAHGFFCRGFSFRFDSATIGDEVENCLLTSSPPTSLSRDSWRSSPGHELYSRGNFGRGCEPALHDDTGSGQHCYLQYDNAAELIGAAVKGRAQVKDEDSCAQACSDAPFRCLSFSFNSATSPDNCLLSEIKLFDLRRGADYEHAPHSWLFAFDLFNGRCYRKVQESPSHGVSHPHEVPSGPSGSGFLPNPGHHGGHLGTGPFIPSGPSDPHTPVYSGVPPGTSFKPNYPSGPGYDTGFHPRPEYPPPFKPTYDPSYTSGPGYRPGGSSEAGYGPDYDPNNMRLPGGHVNKNGVDEENIIVSWDHYTVSGLPCRRGTSCAQNQITGHWACEPEGGEIGSWDYCCAPAHRCGYSEGFHKPWCYVGASEDQWRPCSEKYYPYHQHSTPHPSQGHAGNQPHEGYGPPPQQNRPYRPPEDDRSRIPVVHHHHHGQYLPEEDRKYWDDLYQNGPKSYYDRYGNPLPGYSRIPQPLPQNNYQSGPWEPVVPISHDCEDRNHPGLGVPRYWPVAYLHKGPPPNVTYFKYNETDKNTITGKHDMNQINISYNDTKDNMGSMKYDTTLNNNTESTFANATEPFKVRVDNITTTNEEVNKVSGNSSTESTSDGSKLNESSNKGIDGKIDFSGSIEVLDIEDAKKGEKQSDIKSLEEELQIEAIGRLLASRRIGNLVLEKRSQKEFEAQHIAFDNDKTGAERRGLIQKVTKEDIEREKAPEKSLEMSETTFVRPPRVLATTENIKKAFVNGKVFYDATFREPPKELTRRPIKTQQLEEAKAPPVVTNQNFGKKSNIKPRNVNPVRRVRRIFRKRYNPEEVRRRLLEREKSKESSVVKI